MDISHIEHIGIAVKSIEEAKKYYEGVLGLKCYAIEKVVDQKVTTAFFKVVGCRTRWFAPYRQGSAQGCRRPQHCFPPPEVNFRRAH